MDELLVPTCRYCLQDDNTPDLINPCRCIGSVKYIHKKCLTTWLDQQNNRIIVPGRFHQFELRCELCHSKYNLVYNRKDKDWRLYLDLSLYIFSISSLLFTSYFLVGLLLKTFTEALFINFHTDFQNILFNGFIMVHIILSVFYILAAITNGEGETCCCLGIDLADCGEFLIIGLLLIGILGTLFMVYIDILSRVVQRYENKRLEIMDILPLESV